MILLFLLVLFLFYCYDNGDDNVTNIVDNNGSYNNTDINDYYIFICMLFILMFISIRRCWLTEV